MPSGQELSVGFVLYIPDPCLTCWGFVRFKWFAHLCVLPPSEGSKYGLQMVMHVESASLCTLVCLQRMPAWPPPVRWQAFPKKMRVRWKTPNRCLCGTGATSVVFAPLSSQYGSNTYQQVGLGIQGAAPVRWKPPKAWNKSYKQKRIWGLCYETVLVLRGCNWSFILHL